MEPGSPVSGLVVGPGVRDHGVENLAHRTPVVVGQPICLLQKVIGGGDQLVDVHGSYLNSRLPWCPVADVTFVTNVTRVATLIVVSDNVRRLEVTTDPGEQNTDHRQHRHDQEGHPGEQ